MSQKNNIAEGVLFGWNYPRSELEEIAKKVLRDASVDESWFHNIKPHHGNEKIMYVMYLDKGNCNINNLSGIVYRHPESLHTIDKEENESKEKQTV